MKKIFLIIVAFFFFAVNIFAQKNENIVVVVSLDAFRWDYSEVIGTPNLDRIAKEGVRVKKWQSSFPTITFPNHYAMATGLYPNNHGLVHNTFFNKELGLEYRINKRDKVENGNFYRGEPIWNTAYKQGLLAYNFYWVGSEAEIGNIPRYWKNFSHTDFSYEERIDTVIKWLQYPDSVRPSLIMAYIEDPDATTHFDNPDSGEKTKAIVKRCDSLVGVLFDKIKTLPNAENIHLIIVSDHGMCPISPYRAVYLREHIKPEWIEYGNFGSPVAIFDIKADKLDSALLCLKNVEHISAWKNTDVPERLHYGSDPNIGNLVVVADSAWRLTGNSFEEEWQMLKSRYSDSILEVMKTYDMLGAHGFDNENEKMFGICYAYGKSFKENLIVDELPNIQLYNIICKVLDMKPAENDGNQKDINVMFKSSFDWQIIIWFILLVILLAISACMSASETAIFSLNNADVDSLKTDEKKNASLLNILKKPQKVLATILITNNFVNVASILVSTIIIDKIVDFSQHPTLGFIVETIVITAMLLLLGEITPKLYATTNPLKIARKLLPVLRFFNAFFSPLSFILVKSTSVVEKNISSGKNLSTEDLSQAIDIVTDEKNAKNTTENKFLKSIANFSDIEVSQIMIARVDVKAVDFSDKFLEVLAKIQETGHSRLPVFDETPDKIKGVVHAKDLLEHLGKNDDYDWTENIKSALFISENKKVDSLLKLFQKEKRHIAIVVDEYGGTLGIVTLEDVLEEIVGDINDEFDKKNNNLIQIIEKDKKWLFEAKISINDFCKIVNVDIDYFDELSNEAESLGGMILEQTGIIPKNKAEVAILNFVFIIEEANERMLRKILVIKN